MLLKNHDHARTQAPWRSLIAVLLCACAISTQAGCPASSDTTSAPGTDLTLTFNLQGRENDPIYGNKLAYLHVPASYQFAQPMPLFVLLHGATGNQTLARGQASQLRGVWRAASDAGGFMVASLVGSGATGGWIAPEDRDDFPTDYDMIQALIAQLSDQYNIDPTRRYLWGFSAGGHVALDIALNEFHSRVNSSMFAGFGVNAGVSAGLACAGLGDAACRQNFASGPIKRPIDMHIGNIDNLIAQSIADRSRFNSLGWIEGVTFFWQEFEGSHFVFNEHPLQIWNNLCSFSTRAQALPLRPSQPIPQDRIPTLRSATINAENQQLPGLQAPD